MTPRNDLAKGPLLGNGGVAASILAAGAGCCAMGVLYVIGIVSPKATAFVTFYKPSGALSGESSVAIIVWLGVWIVLHRMWRERDVRLDQVLPAAFALLLAGILLTFPPIARLF